MSVSEGEIAKEQVLDAAARVGDKRARELEEEAQELIEEAHSERQREGHFSVLIDV